MPAAAEAAPGAARRALDGAALALAFLTVLPVRARGAGPGIGAAAPWFPAVGALVGALAGLVLVAAEPLLGPGVAAVLAVTALVVLTGALHQDGLADCADGLGVRGDRARRLAVMRDSAIGAYGALALLLWALLLATALGALAPGDALRALVTAAALGRWAALVHAVTTPPARADGLGATFAAGRAALAAATATAAAAALALHDPGAGLAALAAALAAALLVTAWARRTLGGRTGDTLGAAVTLAEAAVVLTLLGCA